MTRSQVESLLLVLNPASDGAAKQKAVEDLLVDDQGLSSELKNVLWALAQRPDEPVAAELAIVKGRSWEIGAQRYVDLAAKLTRDGRLTPAEGVSALCALPILERSALSVAAKRAVEVAEALAEDSADGFMRLDEDDAFAEALGALVRTA